MEFSFNIKIRLWPFPYNRRESHMLISDSAHQNILVSSPVHTLSQGVATPESFP